MEETIIKTRDLSKILEPFSNEWVALSEDEDRVVSHGKTVREVLEKAKESGVESPIITKVPTEYGNYVL